MNMKRISLLAFMGLINCINLIAQIDSTASAAWQVKKYDISGSITERFLNAKATMSLQNVGNASGSRLTLRISPKAEVVSVKVNDSPTNSTKGEEKLGTSNTLQRIFVSLPAIPPSGTFAITVEYKLKVDENSGLQAITPVGSQFLPLSYWYPTPNSWFAPKGGDYAPVSIQINSTDTVVSSSNPKLSSQPFFITGSWDAIESQGVSVMLPKGASADDKKRGEELAAIAAAARTYVASLLGENDTKLKIVSVRRGAGFADSGIILLDYGAFRRPKVDAQTVLTIAESVAKAWIGNAKPIQGEAQGVIREGLPRFIANEFIEKQYGKDSAENERFRQRVSYTNIAKNEAPISVSTPLDSTHYLVSANKGAMIWRLLSAQTGKDEFFKIVKSQDILTLPTLRKAFAGYSEMLDYLLTNPNDTNLLVGLPEVNGMSTKVNLRNTGGISATVEIVATTEKGERLTETTKLEPKSFGSVSFKTTSKIIRTEIDPTKLYPQLDYSDDIAPREFQETNPIVAIKRSFDRQDFATAEKNARAILQYSPRSDEVRTWLGRSLLSQNKTAEATTEFNSVLSEKLPTSGAMSWSSLGLAEIAEMGEQTVNAIKWFEQSIKSDGEYGATLSARTNLQKLDLSAKVDQSVKSFFVDFDKAAMTGRKTEVELYVSSGEMIKFAAGLSSGQPERWETRLLRTTTIDANHTLAEVTLIVKRLGDEVVQTGTAVFILVRAGNGWKLSGVDSFEVR
jgi:hypothetical protein